MPKKALAGYEKSLGEDHRATLDTVHNIASAFDNQGRYEESLKWFQRPLAGYEKVLGNDHPSTLVTVNFMANTLRNIERCDEAEQLEKQYSQPQR
ncbi:hypothetical protein RUND412_000933 [Rhizina undulata]